MSIMLSPLCFYLMWISLFVWISLSTAERRLRFNLMMLPTREGSSNSRVRNLKPLDNDGITKDSTMAKQGSVSLSGVLGQGYTVAGIAVSPDDSLYILRRRKYATSTSLFQLPELRDNTNDGVMDVDAVLKVNEVDGTLISSFGNNTFYYPSSIGISPTGSFWFSDYARHQVIRLPPGADEPDQCIGTFLTNGTGRNLNSPSAVTVTSTHVYVADGLYNKRIVMYTVAGEYVTEYGYKDTIDNLMYSYGISNMPLKYINVPVALAVDENKNSLFIADAKLTRILEVNAGLTNCSSFGKPVKKYEQDKLQQAVSLAILPSNSLLFALNMENPAYKMRGFTFDSETGKFKGQFVPDEEFEDPRSIAVKSDGSLVYVIDGQSSKLWIFVRSEENSRERREAQSESAKSRHIKLLRSSYRRSSYDRRSSYRNHS